MNLIDSLVPHKLNEDEANALLQSVAEAGKEELLPSFICEVCHKDLNPDEDKFYDSEDGIYCEDCMEKAENKFQLMMDYDNNEKF